MEPDGVALLPTPKVSGNRNSRAALTADGHWAAPALEQAVEMSQGILPREYQSWDEVQGGTARLLPTPKASDGPNGGPGMRNGRGQADALPGAVSLLPTPVADNSRGIPSTSTDYQSLANAVADFGPYAPAIARWEAVLGRPAPSPTEPGKDDRPRLSPAFVEFLMGLPAGHVTAVGLTRAQQLKALGNGVVPQQAAAALRFLLWGEPVGVGTGAARKALPTPTARLGDSRGSSHPDRRKELCTKRSGELDEVVEHLLPTPNTFHAGNEEDPDEWRARRADVFKRTGTRHGPALGVVAKSLLPGEVPLTVDTYMPEED